MIEAADAGADLAAGVRARSARLQLAVRAQVLRPGGRHGDQCWLSRGTMTGDVAPVVGFFPHREARTRCPPRLQHLGVRARVGTEPREEVENQDVDGLGQRSFASVSGAERRSIEPQFTRRCKIRPRSWARRAAPPPVVRGPTAGPRVQASDRVRPTEAYGPTAPGVDSAAHDRGTRNGSQGGLPRPGRPRVQHGVSRESFERCNLLCLPLPFEAEACEPDLPSEIGKVSFLPPMVYAPRQGIDDRHRRGGRGRRECDHCRNPRRNVSERG
jgi:hypothetical protein